MKNNKDILFIIIKLLFLAGLCLSIITETTLGVWIGRIAMGISIIAIVFKTLTIPKERRKWNLNNI